MKLAPLATLICLLFLGTPLVGCFDAAPVREPSDAEEVTVTVVRDGDTVNLSDGRRVRYLGINTPEYGQPYFEEAKEANRRLVEGQTVRMELDTQPTDRFGRTLAHLWVDGKHVNLELVSQGLATAYHEAPNFRYRDAIHAAEQQARRDGAGLWKPSSAPVGIRSVVYDAPGADHENPNGEWVELINEGSAAIDLRGFTLKDEANHIYTFPSTILESGQVMTIRSGQGQDRKGVLYWGLRGDAVWNNKGDTAYLRDPVGRLVDLFSY
ncbi:lamin tail domain-containing protein [Chloroflexota bacterium]